MAYRVTSSAANGRIATDGRASLTRTSLLREVYRSLLNTGRTYAAFRDSDRETIAERLSRRGPVLDPMSGYGRTAAFCAELGIDSICVEFNPPQFLWQMLVHPKQTELHLSVIEGMRQRRRQWPKPRVMAVSSDQFYPPQSLAVLYRLFGLAAELYDRQRPSVFPAPQLAASLILPFAGRLACTSPGDVSAHTKQGGTAVLLGWQSDFSAYLNALAVRLRTIRESSRSLTHRLVLGDARTVDLRRRNIRAMYTSPPYPNHRDFSSIFLPENTFLEHLATEEKLPLAFARHDIIGSNFVKSYEVDEPTSTVAKRFIAQVNGLRRTRRAQYDDDVYYLPYFMRYFGGIEKAYTNVARFLANDFDGYVVVVNNTHRGVVIPVADFVKDVWQSLGFGAEVHTTKEVFHVGSKNPRAKGIRARHVEYVVRVWK